MKSKLRMRCPSCGHWNRVPVSKLFIEQPSPEPKVKVMIPMYEPLMQLEWRLVKVLTQVIRTEVWDIVE